MKELEKRVTAVERLCNIKDFVPPQPLNPQEKNKQ